AAPAMAPTPPPTAAPIPAPRPPPATAPTTAPVPAPTRPPPNARSAGLYGSANALVATSRLAAIRPAIADCFLMSQLVMLGNEQETATRSSSIPHALALESARPPGRSIKCTSLTAAIHACLCGSLYGEDRRSEARTLSHNSLQRANIGPGSQG